METGRTERILEKLTEMIEEGQNVPLAPGKIMVNKDEAVLLIKELENIIQGEQKIYREVNDRRGKIINDAKKEAEDIIYEAEQTASRIRVTKRVSSVGSAFREEKLGDDEREALRTAGDIYAASLIYTDEMLTEVNDVVAQAYDLVSKQYGRMVETLEEKARLIAENKAELMESLKELSKEERYTQILDLGQLLSYELYNERAKARNEEKTARAEVKLEVVDDNNVPDDIADINENSDIPYDMANIRDNSVLHDDIDNIREKAAAPEVKISEQDAVANTLAMFKRSMPQKEVREDD